MEEKIKNNSGITIVALIITLIVLIIIASIAIYEGQTLIRTSKVQTLETNMLTLQVKAKAIAEEIESKIWVLESDSGNTVQKDIKRNAEFLKKGFVETNVDPKALKQVSYDLESNYVAYNVTQQAVDEMDLDEIQADTYVIIFSKSDYKYMDVIYKKGISYKKETIFALSMLQQALSE